MKRTPALVRLEKKLASDPCAILDTAEIRLLDREVRRALIAWFPGVEAYLDRTEDAIRWQALGAACAEARGARGIREVARPPQRDSAGSCASLHTLPWHRGMGRPLVPSESCARAPDRAPE